MKYTPFDPKGYRPTEKSKAKNAAQRDLENIRAAVKQDMKGLKKKGK